MTVRGRCWVGLRGKVSDWLRVFCGRFVGGVDGLVCIRGQLSISAGCHGDYLWILSSKEGGRMGTTSMSFFYLSLATGEECNCRQTSFYFGKGSLLRWFSSEAFRR